MLLLSLKEYTPLSAVLAFLSEYPIVLKGGIILCGLLFWRLFKFSILPQFYSDDSNKLPYWIPGKFSQVNVCII